MKKTVIVGYIDGNLVPDEDGCVYVGHIWSKEAMTNEEGALLPEFDSSKIQKVKVIIEADANLFT